MDDVPLDGEKALTPRRGPVVRRAAARHRLRGGVREPPQDFVSPDHRARRSGTPTKHDRLLLALVARYHRGATPDPEKHESYAALSPEDQRIVARLGAILRFADGLDRSHTNAVQDLRLIPRRQPADGGAHTRNG